MSDVSAGKILALSIEGDSAILDREAERLFAGVIGQAPWSEPLPEIVITSMAEWALDTARIYVNVRRRLIDAEKEGRDGTV